MHEGEVGLTICLVATNSIMTFLSLLLAHSFLNVAGQLT
jgi:hypothetical protein